MTEPLEGHHGVYPPDATESKMTYTKAATPSKESPKPIFFRENDFFGGIKPTKDQWLSHTEIYKAMGRVIPAEHIGGLQRVSGLWRVYIDNNADRASLVSSGFPLRGKHVSLTSSNPYTPTDGHIRVRVKNIPLSADDGQITRALDLLGCVIVDTYREKLRVDNKLTNCETGDRIIQVTESSLVSKPLPRIMQIGKYRAVVIHYGQNKNTEQNKTCNKCLESGHIIALCENDWRCRSCKQSGHKQDACPGKLEDETSAPIGAPHTDQSNVLVASTPQVVQVEVHCPPASLPAQYFTPPTTQAGTPQTEQVADSCTDKDKQPSQTKLQKKKKKQSQAGVTLDSFFTSQKSGNHSGTEAPSQDQKQAKGKSGHPRSPPTPTEKMREAKRSKDSADNDQSDSSASDYDTSGEYY